MSLYNQPNLTSGIDDALISVGQSVPMFPIITLVLIYVVVLLGGSQNQRSRTGNADYPFWSALAGVTITFAALMMTFGGTGIIDLTTLSIVISITILSGLWFFLSKVRGEV